MMSFNRNEGSFLHKPSIYMSFSCVPKVLSVVSLGESGKAERGEGKNTDLGNFTLLGA